MQEDTEDTEEDAVGQVEEQTQPDDPQSADQPQPTMSQENISAPPPKKQKTKKGVAEEQCWQAVGQYYASKQATSAHASQSQPTPDDDAVFGNMVATEMRKVKLSQLKRQGKRQIMEVIFNLQEQEEQHHVQVVQLPIGLSAVDDALPVPGTEGQVVVQIQQQEIPLSAAELLLQLQNQPQK